MVSFPPSYCPYCGTALETTRIEDRERAYCDDCEHVVWHNPVPAAGVAVVDREAGSVLCVERGIPPGVGEWTIPGGHVEFGEQPADAAARELEEETGVAVDPADLTLLDVASLPPRSGKQIVSIAYAVARADADGDPSAGSDAAAARFWTPAEFDASGERFRPIHEERFRIAASTLE